MPALEVTRGKGDGPAGHLVRALDPMLELQALLLRPWTSSPEQRPGCVRTRSIHDPATGASLGLACWQRRAGPAWLRRLRRPMLAVFETEDESLLFHVRRPWALASRWQVRDADERVVGTVRPYHLVWPRMPDSPPQTERACSGHNAGVVVEDRWGRFLLLASQRSTGPPGQFLARDGSELGSLCGSAEGSLLTFAPEVEGEPFTKMLILAAVLVRSDW